MPFIPHTDAEVRVMLDCIGVTKLSDLFDEIPKDLQSCDLSGIPPGLCEMEVARLLESRASKDRRGPCFIGAGAYEHHIPAAVFDLLSRGEFLTAYTPYQAEASQGALQVIYEYQSMMTRLMGMDVSNASLYDGASALAEASLMAVRLSKKGARILLPKTVHPAYRAVVHTVLGQQDIPITEVPYSQKTGRTDISALTDQTIDDSAALIVPQPNFFGVLEDVNTLTNWAKAHDLKSIAQVNPTSLALLKEPGAWGDCGVDIACGEGQPLGIPLASGGPYFGFLCTRDAHVRHMPGRIVGRTQDAAGKRGFTLTLQTREQHIRRSKATSNICTNQGLMVVAATIYLSLLGPKGLHQVAATSHHNTQALCQQLTQIKGVRAVFQSPFFHERVLNLDKDCNVVLEKLADHGIQGGFNLSKCYPELGQSLLVCATETKTDQDIADYAQGLAETFETLA